MVFFKQTQLAGLTIANPTSLQIGPDNRLYAAQDNGVIVVASIAVDGSGAYTVSSRETISLVRFIPNHNDDGSYNPTLGTRQVTGLLVTGTAENPVIYVSSSDPRIGGGANNGDTGLDTNSGTLSRLTRNEDGVWVKVDLVYGLPRSEENHAVNGMQINPVTGHLLLAIGGNTNAGAPSQEFGYLSEYAYASAVVEIDLAAIDVMPNQTYRGQTYKYVLPTVDDPTRSAPGDVLAAGQPEVFGGNNGLNQARLTADSPVQLYATGFRNLYDIVLNENGQLYGIDNGGNPSWGGPPLYVQTDGSLGSTPTANVSNAINDGNGSVNKAPLHLIEEGYYGGHPNPILANPTGAGLYRPDGSAATLPVDWPPVPQDMAQPIAGYYLSPGSNRAAVLPELLQTPLYLRGDLAAFSGSVNGIDDYKGTAFGGEMQGDLIAASLNDDSIYRIDLSADGKSVQSITNLTPGGVLGNGATLDVHAAPETSPFAGTIWVASYGGGITILVPDEDGGSNGDNDDVDNDGLSNTFDPFGVDPTNGQSVLLEGGSSLTWTFSQNEPHPGPGGIGNLGFTGVMLNGSVPYQDLYEANKTIMGGAAAGVLIQDIGEGTPTTNSQTDAYQFGVDIGSGVGSYIVKGKVNNPFDFAIPGDNQSVGFYIGTGDQSNYIKIAAGSATVDGIANSAVIDVVVEIGDNVISHQTIPVAIFGGELPDITASDAIELELRVDPIAGTVVPAWTVTRGHTSNDPGIVFSGEGNAIVASGPLLAAIRGNHTIASGDVQIATGLAVGIIGTSEGPGEPFSATWNSISISSTPKPDAGLGAALLSVTPDGALDVSTFNPNTLKLENLITSGKDLKQVIIDLDHAILPDGAFFDPNAAGGDNGKAFQLNSVSGSFLAKATYQNGSATLGYRQMTIDLTDFNPGESASFSLDIDPNSLLGNGLTVAAGGVSGAELAGSRVTFVFADGSTTQADLFGSGIAQADARGFADLRAAPVVSLQSQTSGNVAFPAGDPSILVNGIPGSIVRVQMMTTAMLSVDRDDAFDGNSATDIHYETIILDASGRGTVSGTLSVDRVLVVAAAEVNASGIAISAVSAPLRIIQQTDPVASVIGTNAGEVLEGTDDNDGIDGKGGNDQLYGFDGDDLLQGGAGNDVMVGGRGDDSYIVDSPSDTVTELANEGNDTVRTTLSTFTLAANVEQLLYTGTESFTGTGNALANVISGSISADRLNGLGGADIMRGGAGNDTYIVENVNDVVVETLNQGNDRVLSQVSYVLAENIETLQLTTSKGLDGEGNSSANTLIGNGGANILDGRGGSDVLTGGAGNDTFKMQRGEANGDRVTDFSGAGVAGGDILYFVGYGADATLVRVGTSDSYEIHSGASFGGQIETIRISGVTNLAASDYVFVLPANVPPSDIVLTSQSVAENADAGTVIGIVAALDATAAETFTYTLLNDGQGKVALVGTELLTTMLLDRETQANFDIVLQVADSAGNVLQKAITISVVDGNDNAPTIVSANSFEINENLAAIGSLVANDADSTGGPVTFSIKPGEGDAEYFTITDGNNLRFVVPADFEDDHGPSYTLTILATDGEFTTEQIVSVQVTDIDESVVNVAPTAIVIDNNGIAENAETGLVIGELSTIDADIGDEASFVLINDAGGRFALTGNTLIAAAPLDFETFSTHSIRVKATDSVGHTIERDLVIAVSDVVAGDVKQLTQSDDTFVFGAGLTFDGIDGLSGDDTLVAQASAVTLSSDGARLDLDMIVGQAYGFSATSIERLTLSTSQLAIVTSLANTALANDGIDTTGTTAGDSLDGRLGDVRINLSGLAGDDSLFGGAQSDALDGGEGNDAMAGGDGDDLYVVDSALDTVTEQTNSGSDTVSTTLTSYTLGANVESLLYTGVKSFTGTGNGLANTLSGGAAADRLDGLNGADTMIGAAGNDTYVVDNTGDVVIEVAGQGNDRVLSQVTYTLSDHVETLQLTTSKALDGFGNQTANTLIGNAGVNILNGRGGSDVLTGGAGSDTFQFQRGEANGDIITDFSGAGAAGGDLLIFSGYGEDAFLTRVSGSDSYMIHGGSEFAGLIETIQIVNVGNLGTGDFLFV